MSLPPPPSSEEIGEDWLTTYADAITLLMCFFVLFFSFSRVDVDVFDQVAKGLSESIGKERDTKKIADEVRENLRDVINSEGADKAVQMGTDAQGSITLTLDGGAFFKPGSADLQEQALPVLRGIIGELGNPIYQQFNISIEGHTDDGPINTPRYPSNWELSTGRASTVVRMFLDSRERDEPMFQPNRLRAIGYAETQPKLPNRDAAGIAIPENQLANRRVVMRIDRRPIYEVVKVPTFRRAAEPAPSEDAAKGKSAKK